MILRSINPNPNPKFERLITCNFAYEVKVCNLFIDRLTRTTYEVQHALLEKHVAWEFKTWNLYKFSPFLALNTFDWRNLRRGGVTWGDKAMGRHNLQL